MSEEKNYVMHCVYGYMLEYFQTADAGLVFWHLEKYIGKDDYPFYIQNNDGTRTRCFPHEDAEVFAEFIQIYSVKQIHRILGELCRAHAIIPSTLTWKESGREAIVYTISQFGWKIVKEARAYERGVFPLHAGQKTKGELENDKKERDQLALLHAVKMSGAFN